MQSGSQKVYISPDKSDRLYGLRAVERYINAGPCPECLESEGKREGHKGPHVTFILPSDWNIGVADLDFRSVIERCGALVISTSPVDGLKKYLFTTSAGAGIQYLATDEGKAAKKATPFFRLWCIVEIAAAIPCVEQDHQHHQIPK